MSLHRCLSSLKKMQNPALCFLRSRDAMQRCQIARRTEPDFERIAPYSSQSECFFKANSRVALNPSLRYPYGRQEKARLLVISIPAFRGTERRGSRRSSSDASAEQVSHVFSLGVFRVPRASRPPIRWEDSFPDDTSRAARRKSAPWPSVKRSTS